MFMKKLYRCTEPHEGPSSGFRTQDMLTPDRAVRDLIAVFRMGYREGKYESGSGPFFDMGLSRIKDMKYSAEDVFNLSLALAAFEHEADFGFRFQRVMNTLVNLGPEDRYVIQTSHLSSRINALGHIGKKKHLTIEGDVGDCTGFELREASLVINGNAGAHLAAKMRSGDININGEFESIADIHGGKVFQRGKQIWPSE
jgi:hypothetical protein